MTTSTALTIKEELNSYELSIIGTSEFPVEVQKGLNNIMDLVQNNITVPELYQKELKETMVSTSIFQDICVQMEEHHTPHRKVRQVMLELSDKLDALDAAKNNHRKKIINLQNLENDINEFQDIYNELDKNDPFIDLNLALRLSNVNYSIKQGMDSHSTVSVIPPNIIDVCSSNPITNEQFINSIKSKVKVALGNKLVDHEEMKRGLKNSQHMIKDSAVKTYQLQLQADKYSKEMANSGISFDESEFIYYTMFFTAEAERQLRTGDYHIDRGTYKAVSQLPDFIRLKVLKNIDYIQQKLNDMSRHNITTDYIFLTDREILEPSMVRDKEGSLWVEGFKVSDYLMMEPISVLTKKIEEAIDDE